MSGALKKALGAGRPKIIAIIVSERAEAEAAIRHAGTGDASLPVKVWCADEGMGVADVLRGMRKFWPALTIVSWTGRRRHTLLKLVPFLLPPFRMVAFNEAGGFFAVRPVPVANHLKRRLRDGVNNSARWVGEQLYSIAYRGGERIRDVAVVIRNAAFYRTAERVRDVFVLTWNLLLAIAAVCAAPFASLTFASVKSRSKGQSNERPMRFAVDNSFVEIAAPDRAWWRGKFMGMLQKSDAQFVAIHRGKVNGAERDELIALARATNAFAVAKQEAYTGWRRQVLPKHPFRILQRGETSEVLAPHSSLIVMRRDMLLQLGIPRAFTTGAALMAIYWKAAAAGWISLTLGLGGKLSQEPAMPLEDAEFVLRLRGLEPVRADQARGNISSSPLRVGARRQKPGVLVVSPYLPFPMSHGGAVRIYNLCRELRDSVDFTLVCFREAQEEVRYEELHQVFRDVSVVDIDEKHADFTVPKQVAEYRNSAMSGLIRRFCESGHIDLVQLEYTQMAEYREYVGAIPVLLVEHDITFTLHRQIAEANADIDALRQHALWLDFERAALQCCNAVWTMSPADLAIALEHGASPRSAAIVPNGVDPERFMPRRRGDGPPTVLFVGSFRHLPNLLAYELLREQIMPRVWRDFPEARFHAIAGPAHEKWATVAGKANVLRYDSRITVSGFVEDVRDAYRDCDAVAIPVPISAGTNIKVMEAMACGRAAVSTSVGCQGLGLNDGHDILIRDNPEAFASALVDLLSDSGMRQRMSQQARRTVEMRFAWSSIARAALASYDSLTGGSARDIASTQSSAGRA